MFRLEIRDLETRDQRFYIKREQQKVASSDRFEDDKKRKMIREIIYEREDFKSFIHLLTARFCTM